MEVRREVGHGVDQMSAPEFDHDAYAEAAKAATRRREHIASETAKLMAYAERFGWGPQVGLPTMAGDTLVFHFETGRRGFIRLPLGSEF